MSDLTATSSVYASVMTWVPHRTAVKRTELTRKQDTRRERLCGVEWSAAARIVAAVVES